jgi:hypothetical protein
MGTFWLELCRTFLSHHMGAVMAKYRAFTIGDDGHFTSYRAFTSVDDAEAIVWAKQLVDHHAVELWSGDRFIIRLDHHRKSGGQTAL